MGRRKRIRGMAIKDMKAKHGTPKEKIAIR